MCSLSCNILAFVILKGLPWLLQHAFFNLTLYYGAVECLNLIERTFWGVQLFSGKRTANVVPGSSLDRITVPYHFAKWFLLFQRSYNRKITKSNNDTGQKINTVNKRIKSTHLVHVFATELHFIMYGKHTAYSLSPALGLSLTDAHIVCTHLNISTNVVSTTLMILSLT